MSHKKPKRYSHRFELAPENPQHELLEIFLSGKAENDEVSGWIRDTLIQAMLAETFHLPGPSPRPAAQEYLDELPQIRREVVTPTPTPFRRETISTMGGVPIVKPLQKRSVNDPAPSELRYEPIED